MTSKTDNYMIIDMMTNILSDITHEQYLWQIIKSNILISSSNYFF